MPASVAHTSAPTSHHYTTLGLDSRKVAIWAFIGSECMLFVSLIST
ncbi:MAG TPA: cytochrome oxidase subunit III, partial [Gemmatimonadetes bacterium]|nr:cytochrome oxidase subunit III [Gemmatimonadota bacterium]